MDINYIYNQNSKIQDNIIRIETAKRIIEFLPKLPQIEKNLQRKSLLKSSLFSAKIEGNSLRLNEIEYEQKVSKNKQKQEIYNILRALNWISSDVSSKKITIDIIIRLHQMVMQDISSDGGKFRIEPSAIFNQAGVAIYMSPPPSELPRLLKQMIKLSEQNEHPVIVTAIVHFAFEKIHPFLDGNGRVGRLLSTFLLKNSGYDFRGLAIFEEYLSDHRDDYYSSLSISNKDITEFVEFFTESLAVSAENVIELLQDKKEEKPEDSLLPRRQEILAIIKEHKLVSFDFIRRRFIKVPESSLHYDLKMLQKMRFVKKLGSTRGVLYSLK